MLLEYKISSCPEEVAWVASLAEKHKFIKGIVGGLDLTQVFGIIIIDIIIIIIIIIIIDVFFIFIKMVSPLVINMIITIMIILTTSVLGRRHTERGDHYHDHYHYH